MMLHIHSTSLLLVIIIVDRVFRN